MGTKAALAPFSHSLRTSPHNLLGETKRGQEDIMGRKKETKGLPPVCTAELG